jgi:hypothetical protein
MNLKIEAAHAGHPQISNNAKRCVGRKVVQEFLT